ncbi:MAG: T9SS type A sorting domain-containing protein [Flavobacteriales bacterium]|nr:T9SS type A sorting domain-containing protein [Flavobacteriales bacterium]
MLPLFFNTRYEMMKPYATPILTMFLSSALMGQTPFLELRDVDGNVVNGTTINVEGPVDQEIHDVDLISVLQGSAPKDVNLRRYTLSLQPGVRDYFCWGLCYLDQPSASLPVWNSVDPVLNMQPGVEYDEFHAYYMPVGTEGTSCYRYVLFDMNGPDTTYVDICFNAMPVGIDELGGSVSRFDVYPNPVVGSSVVVNYDLKNAPQAQLTVYNVLGEQVIRRQLAQGAGKVTLQEGTLPEGLWFANIESNGQVLATQRIVVGR